MSSAGAARPLPRVAVLGVGTMGRGMARSLLRNGFTVDAWDRTPQKAAALAADGATAHEDARDAVRDVDVVITMVADADAVNQLAFESGMLEALRPQTVWAQMGTIGVTATEELACGSARNGPTCPSWTRRCSAPASPPTTAAADPGVRPRPGEAGARTDVRRAGPGDQVARRGRGGQPAEAGHELLAGLPGRGGGGDHGPGRLARRGPPAGPGLPPRGEPGRPAAAAKFAKMDAGDDSPDFALQWALKDIRLAMDASGRRLPRLEVIRERWTALVGQGLGDRDVSAARHGLG